MFHEIIAKYSPMGDDVNHSPDKAGMPTDAYQPSRLHAIEELPLALGFAIVNGGAFRRSIEDGINSGRDTDSIGVMAGAILGAMHGEAVIDAADLALLDKANRLDLTAEADRFADTAEAIIDRQLRRLERHRQRAPSAACPYRGRQGRLTYTEGTDVNTRDIYERIYAGFIAKAIGVRLGAPVEPTIWTLERIEKTYGEVTQYLHDFKNFAADDDTNGPVYFIRVLRDYGLDFTAEQEGKTWLNYAAEEHGMYWWGGFGRSTEHTAYLNLRNGIPAPASGSIATNGAAIAEQIGGQIFIDSWGWLNPGNPQRAADMSARAASVAHDGNGLHGARWVAAAIAQAFVAKSIDEIVDAAMATIPGDSEYARVAKAVIAHHKAHPDDWRSLPAYADRRFRLRPLSGRLPHHPQCGRADHGGALRRRRPAAHRRDRDDGGVGHRLQRRQCGGDRRHLPGPAAGLGQVSQADQRFPRRVGRAGFGQHPRYPDLCAGTGGARPAAQRRDAGRAVGRGFRAARTALRLRCAGLDAWVPHRGAATGSCSATPTRCTPRLRAARSRSSSTGWSAGRVDGCSTSRGTGRANSTTSATARCSRRWRTTARSCASS